MSCAGDKHELEGAEEAPCKRQRTYEPCSTLAVELGVGESETTDAQEEEYSKVKEAYDRLRKMALEEGAEIADAHQRLEEMTAAEESDSVRRFASEVRNLMEDVRPASLFEMAEGALDGLEEAVSAELRLGGAVSGETVALNGGDAPEWVQAAQFSRDLVKANHEYPRGNTVPPSARTFPRRDNVSPTGLFALTRLLHVGFRITILGLFGRGRPARKISDFDGSMPSDDDAYFVQQRLMGVNPAAITRLTPEARDAVNAGLDITGGGALPDDAQLFMCDYAALVPFAKQLGGEMYVPAPLVVLRFEEGPNGPRFLPAAILLDQAGVYPEAVVPGDTPEWRFAKMCARAADWNVHEIGSHLTLTHLVVETVCLFTYQQLPTAHPLYQLLKPHFYKTLPLNASARKTLVPDIIAKYLTAFNTEQSFAVIAALYNGWNFREHYVPDDLQRRGVAQLPASAYPFGATSALVWEELLAYVTKVLARFYTHDGDLARDVLLQQWLQALAEIPGFPEVNTVAELADALTMVMYTASHQHSAVNYFQAQFLSYAPTAPSALFNRPPFGALTEKALLGALPTPQVARLTTAVLVMLSDEPASDHRLGEFEFPRGADFAKDELAAMQSSLLRRLAALNVENPPPAVAAMVSNKTLAQSVLI